MKIKTVADIIFKNIEHGYYKITSQHHRIIPYKVVVELTTRCNSKCDTCDIWKIKKEDQQQINLEYFESFLQKMSNKLLWIALTGGEISTYNQFPEVVQLIKKYSTRLRILTFTTNGLLPQRILDFALLMKNEIGCDIFITISLDGDEHMHDKLRGIKGNYSKCMETYRLLKEHNIPCHFGITISEYNSLFVLEKYKQYKNQIKAVTFFHTGGIFLNGNNTHYHHESDWRIEAALTEIYKQYKVSTSGEMLTKLYVKAGIFFLKKKRQTNVIPCDVGYSSIHLMANGELLPCMYLPPIKKITEGFDLKNFHSPQAQNQLKEIKQNKCPHCWMSCYGPHNMMQSPFQTISIAFKKIE